MTSYAITGASGQLGRLAVHELLAAGVPSTDVVAVVRTRGKAVDLADRGVKVREADYTRPETLGNALGGVDRLLLISSSEAGQRVTQHTNVIQAARTAGTARIVYTSILNADDTTNPLAGEHQDTEHALRAAGVPFTLLRNGWYTENYTEQLDQYLRQGEILGAAAHGRISAATRQDYASAAAAALLDDDDGSTWPPAGSSGCPPTPTPPCAPAPVTSCCSDARARQPALAGVGRPGARPPRPILAGAGGLGLVAHQLPRPRREYRLARDPPRGEAGECR